MTAATDIDRSRPPPRRADGLHARARGSAVAETVERLGRAIGMGLLRPGDRFLPRAGWPTISGSHR